MSPHIDSMRDCRDTSNDIDCATTKSRLRDLRQIVAHYRRTFRPGADRELQFFRIQRTFQDVLRRAGLAEGPGGKRQAHQRRIPGRVLRAAEEILQRQSRRLLAAKTFEQLHDIVEGAIRPLRGVGELMVYDTALRIASWRHLEPEHVFLHAGTRVGARALGLPSSERFLSVAGLPRELRAIRPHEIEDVLCIYKTQLADLRSARRDI